MSKMILQSPHTSVIYFLLIKIMKCKKKLQHLFISKNNIKFYLFKFNRHSQFFLYTLFSQIYYVMFKIILIFGINIKIHISQFDF